MFCEMFFFSSKIYRKAIFFNCSRFCIPTKSHNTARIATEMKKTTDAFNFFVKILASSVKLLNIRLV